MAATARAPYPAVEESAAACSPSWTGRLYRMANAAGRSFDTGRKTLRRATQQTARRTRPRRIHAPYPNDPCRDVGPVGPAGAASRGHGRHVRRSRQGAARLGRHQLAVGDRRRLLRDVHAGGLRLPGDRLLARQERGHRRRQDPHELLDRGDPVLGGGLRLRLRRRDRPHHRRHRVLPARLRRSAEGLPDHGPLGRHDRVEVVLPVRLLRRLAGDRVGHDARAHQVRRLRHLRGRLQRAHLPDRLGLGLRRRLAAGQRRHAGLRRLDGGPPDRRHRRARRAAAARPASRQVRR